MLREAPAEQSLVALLLSERAVLLLQIEGLDDRKQMRANLFGDSDSEDEAEEPSGKKALAALAARKRLEQQEAVRGSACWWCPCCCCTSFFLSLVSPWQHRLGCSNRSNAHMRSVQRLPLQSLQFLCNLFSLLRKS